MRFFESLLVALSTYSALPMPQFAWNEKNMKYAICFFPAVGVLCGGALYLWYALAQQLQLGGTLFAAVAAALPILITGGIHLDGFMDTMDALSSHQTRERMLEIMKDSHTGAFAAIYCGVYLLLSFGIFSELYRLEAVAAVCPIFIVSRVLSGLTAVNLPNARKGGMLCAYTENTDRTCATAALLSVLLLAAALTVWAAPIVGTLALLGALLSLVYYRHLTLSKFGGVTGDTSGFFLQICEVTAFFGAGIGGLIG